MPAPILVTKLYIPPPRLKVVLRPRLLELLNEGLQRKLILISAPAGFGKTTLVSEWIAGLERLRLKVRVAWLSLDEGDIDRARFLAYIVAALQTIAPNIGEGVLDALQSPQPPPTESILTILLNEIATIPESIVLVLDDYHEIDAIPVDNALTYLLKHLPPQMHLVITTREYPHLPLALLRGRGQLAELRASDLRFTHSEAAEFLNSAMGLNLSPGDIAALETRTEGWIAGLQMAALSLQGRADSASFIQAFTGSHRFVLDYLVEEVLQHQPETIRSFLLHTAILERLNASLCDAVTGLEGSRGILEALERGNLFVVSLDDQRQWYRYHRLFAEVLQARALEEQPNQIPALHQRASVWYEQNNLPIDAVRHVLAARDFERAARLLEQAYPAMDRSFQFAAWLSWVKKPPDDLVRTRPVLCVDYAWALTDNGEFKTSESWLREAERRLEGAPEEMVAADEAQIRALPAQIALARAYHAQAQGDIPNTVKYAELALELIPEDDYLNRAGASVQLGIAYWGRGDLAVAHKAMADWVNHNQKSGNILFVIPSAFFLAEISIAQGHLREAERIYKQTLQLASTHDQPVSHVTAPLFLGLGLLYHETGEDEAVAQCFLTAEKLGAQTVLVDWPYRWRLAQAALKEAKGDPDAALELLDEAKRLYVRISVPDLRPIDALKARVYVRQGMLTEALAWVDERGLSADDELSYLGEFEHLTMARVLLARYLSERDVASNLAALKLLERLRQSAEETGRIGNIIEILVVQALAYRALGNSSLALASLEHALNLAEPEGYVRIFVDEGPPMRALLQEAAKKGVAPNYIRRLQAAFGIDKGKTTSTNQSLIEPLSERELDVLRLLRTDLSGPEIAREMVVSLNTLRTHTKNIFKKLGVDNRRAAVHRAEELDLF